MLWILGIAVYLLIGIFATYVGVRWLGLPKDAAGAALMIWPMVVMVPLFLLAEWVAEKADK
jgi:hypothetical protein